MASGRRSVMKHNFAQVPSATIPRSSIDRSHGHKLTLDGGLIVPIYFDEKLPGDTDTVNMHAFGRLATPLHPFMDNLFIDTFWFFTPTRLVWENWQKFNGEQEDPTSSTDYLVPQIDATWANGSLGDYFGIPTDVSLSVNALPFRCFNLIYNEWFRDQNLQDSIPVPKGDGPDAQSNYSMRRRGKRHDYFSGSLPFPQKGPSVELPLGERAEIFTDAAPTQALRVYSTVDQGWQTMWENPAPTNIQRQSSSNNPSLDTGALYTDLATATAATINSLRQAFAIQKLYERDARGGTRYTEIIRSHFGVVSPDARLQRPEFLGGGSSPIVVNPVAQTSETTAESAQGNLAALGTLNISGHGFTKSFTEHGYVIGLASVRADLTYQQGLNRMWSRRTRWDFYWPALSHIGEQAVLNKEIYAQGTAADDDVWGYQERHADYRYMPSRISGQFRSNFAQSLDTWHLAQDFTSLPVLDETFIEDNPPIDRVVAVPSYPDIILDCYFRVRSARPMPLRGVPGLIDHF